VRETNRWLIPSSSPRSLVWWGDELYDPVAGWTRFALDGTRGHGHVFYTYSFDRAVISKTGVYSALYTALGTKGLLLKGIQVHYELNRSYYCANAYEYPLTFMQLPDGSEALIHCPDAYGRLEIDRADSGERLTNRTSEMPDIFHSRLQVSADSSHLLSAGWFWHPFGTLKVYDLEEALAHPETLDGPGVIPLGAISGEVASATFLDNEHVLVATSDEEPLDNDWQRTGALGPRELGVWALSEHRWVSRVPLEKPLGTMMPLGTHVVGFYEYPKLIEIATGQIVAQWPDLRSGKQESSVIADVGLIPPLALDPAGGRFAVASEDAIAVIQLTAQPLEGRDE
jgi:hypothetical protein